MRVGVTLSEAESSCWVGSEKWPKGSGVRKSPCNIGDEGRNSDEKLLRKTPITLVLSFNLLGFGLKTCHDSTTPSLTPKSNASLQAVPSHVHSIPSLLNASGNGLFSGDFRARYHMELNPWNSVSHKRNPGKPQCLFCRTQDDSRFLWNAPCNISRSVSQTEKVNPWMSVSRSYVYNSY